MGQKNNVYIQYLIVPNSLEESMFNAINNKRKNINNVMKQIETTVQEEETEGSQSAPLEKNIKCIADTLDKKTEPKTLKKINEATIKESEPIKEDISSTVREKVKKIKIKSHDKELMEQVAERIISRAEQTMAKLKYSKNMIK